MRRRLRTGIDGGMAVEFALIAPLIILLAVGSLQLGLAIWRWNVLQRVAETTARCVAIGAANCVSVGPGCAISDAGICYAQTAAMAQGISDLPASAVSIDRTVARGSLTFTSVSVTYPIEVLTMSWSVTASASFPNN